MKANELKFTDLMIGDWVLFEGTPAKILGVEIYGNTLYVQINLTDLWHVSGFEPIPLTPEILEKNGFYRSEIPTRDEIGNYYHRKTAPSSIFVSMSFEDGRDFGNEIRYVHELQHLLKLCGIEKEIVV